MKIELKNNKSNVNFFNSKNEKKVNELVIDGDIVPDGYECYESDFTTRKLRDFLNEANGDDVILKINSCGGSAFDAVSMYNMLKDYKGNVKTICTGLAASAASIVLMAGDDICLYENSTIMIHEASTFCFGTKKDIEKRLNMLNSCEEAICKCYENVKSKDDIDFKVLIEAETWIVGEEAKNYFNLNVIKNDKKLTNNSIKTRFNEVQNKFNKNFNKINQN